MKESELLEFVSQLFSRDTLMEIGMDKRQSDIFMKKFDELIQKRAKVSPCFLFCVTVI